MLQSHSLDDRLLATSIIENCNFTVDDADIAPELIRALWDSWKVTWIVKESCTPHNALIQIENGTKVKWLEILVGEKSSSLRWN